MENQVFGVEAVESSTICLTGILERLKNAKAPAGFLAGKRGAEALKAVDARKYMAQSRHAVKHIRILLGVSPDAG
jgi:hypothetical protein